MSGAPRNESLARLTDIVVDKILDRLGTSGVGLADDFVQRVNQALGQPLEVKAQSPASSSVTIGATEYTLPSGARLGLLNENTQLQVSAGTISFSLGTISTGTNSSFTLINIPTGQYARALIQFKADSSAINVTYGSPASSLISATYPSVLDGYLPVCLVELHSSVGGTGVVDVITQSNLVYLLGSPRIPAPKQESQTVTASSQTLFTLSTITIPQNRLRLKVWQNGLQLFYTTHFSVPADNQVILVEAAPKNAVMTFEI